MKKLFIRTLSVMLAVVLTLSAAPLSEFFGVDHNHNLLDASIEANAASNIVINGVDIGYAHNSYFTKNGKSCANIYWASGRCHKNGVCDSTAHSQCNCMRYWPTGQSSTCQVDLLASQCFGFSRYCQWKVYGYHDGSNASKFTNLGGLSSSSCTGANLKNLLLNCAPATHVRTKDTTKGYGHSITIISADSNGAEVADCNSDGYCKVRVKTYTWSDLASFLKGYGGVSYAYSFAGQSAPTTFTKDTKYPTPISTYPKATSGVITVYNKYLTAYSTSTRNIAYNDLCTVNAVYTNGYCQVTYPTNEGNHTEYAKWSDFAGGTGTPSSWSPSSNTNAFTRLNMSEVFGVVYPTDSCTVVHKSGNNWQIIYPITGGYKMGWVDSTSAPVTPENERPATTIPGPVASGAFSGKTIVAVAPNKITLSTNPVAYISAGDICKITNVNPSTGMCTVQYPSGSSDVFTASNVKTVTISINNFINYNGTAQAETAKIPYKLTAYPSSSMSHTVGSYTSNWWLDPGDTYTTINNINGNTEVLYYCSQGAHAGCWKLGWVKLDYFSLDLNGYLDKTSQGGLMTYGTADIYINGIKRADDVTDFYSANGTYPAGSNYEIKDIRAYKGYTYNGVYSGKTSGTLTSNTSVSLNFTKNPVTVAGIVVTTNPTKTTYLEGESLNTSGLVVTANFSDGTNKNVTASCSFSGYDKNTPGTQTVKVTYSGKTTSFTVNVKSKSPTGISITAMPSKTSYCIGEAVNLTGLAVKATYNNNTSAAVTDYDYYDNYDITDTTGTKTITVSYTYNGVTKSTSFNITVQAHSYTSKVTTAATCEKAGVRTYTCSKCSHSYTETIAAKGHIWNGATCTSPQTCSVCNATSGTAAGHSYTSKVTTAATCTAAGVRTYTCSKCSHSYTETIAKLGHNYSSSYTVDTPATCTTAGSKSQHCTRCTAKQNVTSIPATGHSYTSKITKEPTCTATGVRTYTCSKCSHSYTETIAAAGHKWAAATCTAKKTCSVCKTTSGEPLGHSYTSKVTTAATCTATGVKTFTCSRCSNSYTETIAAKGHTVVTDKAVAATCTTAGKTEGSHCSVCNAVIKAQTTVPAKGHNYVSGTCSNCGKPNPVNGATVTMSSASATAGNQVKVSVSLKNNPGITSMLLKVIFDTTKLQLVSVEDGGNLGTPFHSDSLNSPFTLSWANDTATTNYTYNGDIVVLTFKIKDGAALGSTPITITYDYDNYDIIDKDMNPVEFNVVNGSVNIIDIIIGDVNNDGKVNQLDRVVLTRYLANWTEYPEGSINTVAADVNCDGKVNTLDRVILTRYIANWTGYESLPYNN